MNRGPSPSTPPPPPWPCAAAGWAASVISATRAAPASPRRATRLAIPAVAAGAARGVPINFSTPVHRRRGLLVQGGRLVRIQSAQFSGGFRRIGPGQNQHDPRRRHENPRPGPPDAQRLRAGSAISLVHPDPDPKQLMCNIFLCAGLYPRFVREGKLERGRPTAAPTGTMAPVRMLKFRVAAAMCAGFLAAGVPAAAAARVERLEILDRTVFAEGFEFGPVGAYERIKGRLHFAVDPDAAANSRIVDLHLAPVDSRGLVTFSADFVLLKPVNPALGNGRLHRSCPCRQRLFDGVGVLDFVQRMELGCDRRRRPPTDCVAHCDGGRRRDHRHHRRRNHRERSDRGDALRLGIFPGATYRPRWTTPRQRCLGG